MRKLLTPLFLTLPLFLTAQKQAGSIKGSVYDDVNDYALQSASVTVFKTADSSVVEFQLSNNNGEFYIKNIPVKTALFLVVTHTGYKQLIKNFELDSAQSIKDFKKIPMLVKGNDEMEEVVVKAIQPIRMNGDTLEINPDAFKLDSNAVVEDMLLRVPGLTIWGDGTITMNGRKLDKVYVDGKPFFGGATQTATQNLPKNAIDKIQIYQEKDLSKIKNTDEKVDSLYAMNIKLKEDKKKGIFGKVGAGYGTDERYTSEGVLQAYDKKNQFGIAVGINNINKSEGTGESAFEGNTFKSNFRIYYDGAGGQNTGITRRTYGNLKWQHSFSDADNSQFYNRITADYGNLNTRQDILSNSINIQNINDYKLNSIGDSKNLSVATSNNAKLMYENRKQYGNFVNFTASYNNQHSVNDSRDITEVSKNGIEPVSKTISQTHSISDNDNMLVFGFIRSNDAGQLEDPRKNYMLFFSGGYNKTRSLSNTINQFDSFVDTIPSNIIDRRYSRDNNDYHVGLTLNYDGFKNLLMGIYNFYNINVSLSNYINISKSEQNSIVTDLDTATHNYIENPLLTYLNTVTDFTYSPGLNLNKSFSKFIREKYDYWINISLDLPYQLINQRNQSSILERNIDRNFATFAPRLNLNYQYQKVNRFRIYSYVFGNINLEQPSIDQLYPIVDSTERYNMIVGNPNLKASTARSVTWNLDISRNKMNVKSNYNAGFNLNVNNTKNAISDNVVYDGSGRSKRYLINVKNQNNLRVGFNSRFSNTIDKKNSISISYNGSYSNNNRPGLVNSIAATSTNSSVLNSFNIQYNLIDKFNITLGESVSTNKSLQKSQQQDISSKIKNYSTNSNVNYFVTKSLTLNTSLNYQNNRAANNNSMKATIWNASAIYRFMKQKAEVKFSAFDLLHENKNISNFVNQNSATTTISNGLQQYFMITFSYYPRKFGGGSSKNNHSSGVMIISK